MDERCRFWQCLCRAVTGLGTRGRRARRDLRPWGLGPASSRTWRWWRRALVAKLDSCGRGRPRARREGARSQRLRRWRVGAPGRCLSGRASAGPGVGYATHRIGTRRDPSFVGRGAGRRHRTSWRGATREGSVGRVEIFVDTANLEAIQTWLDHGVVDGVTTNPSIMLAEGIYDLQRGARRIAEIAAPRPVSIEVTTDDLDEMLVQARDIATWGANVVVKIPVITS